MDSILKRIMLITLLSISLVFTSCSAELPKAKKNIEKTATEAMGYFYNHDVESLFSLFSKDMQENRKEETIKEIEKIYDFFDGEMVSYKYDDEGGMEAKKNEDIYYYRCNPTFNVTTDKGTVYRVKFTYYYIWDEKPEYEGICKVRIFEMENTENNTYAGIPYYE